MINIEDKAHNAQCVCEHPVIIQNPQLGALIAQYGTVHTNVGFINISNRSKYLFQEYVKRFSAKRLHITINDISDWYVLDNDSGETFPMFLAVPCNHCDICKEKKINSFVQRCRLEAACYDYDAWFVTLTYDNMHLPADGVNVRDLQLFFKRIRQWLVRNNYEDRIRYVACGEYGKKTKRAHYHALIWNLPFTKPYEFLKFNEVLRSNWQNGLTHCRMVDPTDDSAYYYTAKYMRKTCKVPKGKKPCFFNSSRGHGGIGSHFIDAHKDELRRTLNPKYKYRNPLSSSIKEIRFDSYILNRVFPSFCRSVPVEFRRSLNHWMNAYYNHEFQDTMFDDYIEQLHRLLLERLEPVIYINKTGTNLTMGHYSSFDDFLNDGEYLLQTSVNIDLNEARELANKRNVFLAKLYENKEPVDIATRAYNARQRHLRSYSLEQL